MKIIRKYGCRLLKQTIMIAGGIGITPYRVVLKELVEGNTEIPRIVRLFYSDSNEEYLYKEEFDKLKRDSHITIEYIKNREYFTKEIKEFSN
ncbi:hypothetical protein GOQ27_13600 [Clostridium sp. D2Q-11]|uniref:Oxidoreductase FAD/NAD(P)-binding domain-containing protein n=1 Tax=Anaeromonas frigoriresistens TaxID=2683708 RepID=A0A942UWR7_9FIRM|nr:hypothetical protein [Anaeromonas frigoriresistens]MBS4539505.1 hypothetical protein [Anaeromonas frigoriresistens]